MESKLAKIVDRLAVACSAEAREYRGDVSLVVARERIQDACKLLKELGFDLMSTLSAVDYGTGADPRFHVIYQFTSTTKNLRLELRVPVPGINPVIPSVSGIYRNANWRERELWDMFGIKTEGHPDLRRLILPADWEGHPLRKDYPLGYEEPQFTFNYEEIDLRKPYAKE